MATMTAPQPFRVVREDGGVEREAPDYGTAFIAALPNIGWRVQAQHEGQWLPAHLAFAQQILAARVGTTVDTFDGPLTKNHGGWPKEAGARADAAGEAGSPEWYEALGRHETATLTSDGRGAIVEGWCSCGAHGQARYERWSARGREAHGFVCSSCRFLTQTG